MRPILFLAAAACVVGIATGCSTYRTREFPVARTASTYLGAASERGLTVAAEALIRPERCRRYLWFDCVRYGFLPVVVRVKNGSDANFRLERTDVKCVLGDGTAFEVAPIDQVYESLRYSGARAIPSFLLAIIPGVIHLVHLNNTNSDLLADYEEKHLFVDRDALRVGPDDRLSGVIFFRLPEENLRPNLDLTDALLEVKVTKERGPEGGDVEELTLRPQVEFAPER